MKVLKDSDLKLSIMKNLNAALRLSIVEDLNAALENSFRECLAKASPKFYTEGHMYFLQSKVVDSIKQPNLSNQHKPKHTLPP